MFAFQDVQDRVEVAFTDRHGDLRGGPLASDQAAVARAFGRGRELSCLASMRQVHGARVHVVDDPRPDPEPPEADALVTALTGVALVVRVADCVPVLLADPIRGVVGAAHAGRRGLVAGVVPATLHAMRGLGAREVTAWIGPHVCGSCYEVPESLRAEVAAEVPESHAETSWGTSSVDLGAGVRAQLAREGVTVLDVARCTMEDPELFSFRRDGARAGRQAGLVWTVP